MLTAIIAASWLFVSCPNEIQAPRFGSLSLSTDGSLSRTIQPSGELIAVDKYRVSGTGPSGEYFTPVESETSPINVDGLIEGSWSIMVEGLNASGTTIATKTMTVAIVSGQKTDATFTLQWLEGLGNLDVTITWPASTTSFTRIQGILSQGTDEIETFDLLALDADTSGTDKTITQSFVGLATGSYDFVLTFHDANGSRVGLPYMDQVNIYDGMSSTGTCTIPEILLPVETPEISPTGGRIEIGQQITITSASTGVAIYYTIDGSIPTVGSTLYTGSFVLEKNSTVKAIALDPTRFASAMVSATFEVPASAPTFSEPEDTYDSPRTLTMSTATDGATIHYTLDGVTDPTKDSATYSSALSINENTTVKAIALHADYGDSEITTAEYLIRASAPQFSLDDANPYRGTQQLTLTSATTGATILYTVNGDDPSTNGLTYDPATGISLSTSTVVKAISREENMVDSALVTKSYSIPPIAAMPVIEPEGGTYASKQTVTITTTEEGGTTRYTTNGDDPTASSTPYTVPFDVEVNTMVKAITVKDGYWDSDVAQKSYQIQAAAPVFSPAAGSHNGAQTVTITSATSDATIRYTTDGTDPTGDSPIYSSAISVPQTKTIKAYSSKSGMADSNIVTGEFVILGTSGVSIVNPTHFDVALQLPAGWEGAIVASNAGGTATAVVTPVPADGEVTYTWYLDGLVAKNNANAVASTGGTLRFGGADTEVTLGPGPHLLAVKVSKGTMTYSAQKLISASLAGTTYVVSFNAQGGSTASPTAMTVTNGFPYGTLATTSKPGYDFGGWWTGTSGTGTRITEATNVDIGANQTLYAAWTPAVYTVTFDAQQGETPIPATKDVTHASTYGALATVSRDGYTFDGWWTAPEGAGSQVTAESTVGITADQMLYAKWIPPITVTFDAQGGINLNPTSKTVMYGDTYGTLATTVKLGHTLAGWTTGENGAGTQVTSDSTVTESSNHTLYAKWVPNTQTITFDSQDGTSPDPATKVVTYGQAYGDLASTTREGYTFAGWWTGVGGTGSQVTKETVFTGVTDRTLYAKWVFNVYTGPAGGLVFYENPHWETDGWRYLEAAPYGWYAGDTDSNGAYSGEEDPTFQWGAYGYAVDPPATATAIGTGAINTDYIVNYHDNLWVLYSEKGGYYINPTDYYAGNDGTVAAKVCTDYRGGGNDDWFLPSTDELNLIYLNQKDQGLGGFSEGGYWSSSESRAGDAWYQYFGSGDQSSTVRYLDGRVRPVRAF